MPASGRESTTEPQDGSALDATDGDPLDVEYTAAEYETTVGARSIPRVFRDAILDRYGHACPVSGVDHDSLLDVAHVLPWRDHPDHRTDPGNVLALSKTHHAAFDAGLFTLDREFALHADPDFETDCDLLGRTILDRSGSRVESLEGTPQSGEFLARHDEQLE